MSEGAAPGRRVAILTYHSLDESRSPISTSPRLFRRQLETLHRLGHEAVTLEELTAGWDAGERPERPKVVISFDDGLASVLEQGLPLMRELGFRATIFAVAGRLGGDSDWPGQPGRIPRQRLLSAAELAELAREGWEIGSHGTSHRDLSPLGVRELEEEVAGSKRRLEEQLGLAVTSFAYPYGRRSAAAARLVASVYRRACSTELGFVRPTPERLWLRRVDARCVRNPWLFRMLLTPLGGATLAPRAALRRAGWQGPPTPERRARTPRR